MGINAHEAYEVRSNSNGDFLHNERVKFAGLIDTIPQLGHP